jgi:hypothetical protein
VVRQILGEAGVALNPTAEEQILRQPSPSGSWQAPSSWVSNAVGFGLPFSLVLLLALEAGGYDLVLRSQVGVIVWWALLLGVATGVLPILRQTRQAGVILAVFGGFVALTALATLTWTESAERSVIELSRVFTLFGAFTLLLFVQGRRGLKLTLGGVATAVALVAVLSLADRFHQGLLPFGTGEALPAGYPRARLNWPLEYWNGLAALMAIGAPLLVAFAGRAGVAARALAAGAVPLAALALYMTASRGGLAAASLAVLILLILSPRRLYLLAFAAVPLLGTLLLLIAVNSRPEVRDAIPGEMAAQQGSQMIWICVGVFLGVGSFQYGLGMLSDRGRLMLPVIRREVTAAVGVAAGGIVLTAVVIALISGFAADRWQEFKQPDRGATVERLNTVKSSERYFNWKAALDAASTEKLTGIGPGTFEYFWARNGQGEQFVRDAHSIYLENLAEMGPVALLLVIALILGPIAISAQRSFRRLDDERSALLAAAAAGMAAFAVAAAVDWAWEMTVLPVAFFALAAAALGAPVVGRGRQADQRPFSTGNRVIVAVLCLLAISVIAVPLISTERYRSSQELVRRGDLAGALAKAKDASDLQPWAASSLIQQAQVLDLAGRDNEAVAAARQAVQKERGNWRNWLVLSQALADLSPARAKIAVDRALTLNPRSPYLQAESKRMEQGP